jgi:hypothetical protein
MRPGQVASGMAIPLKLRRGRLQDGRLKCRCVCVGVSSQVFYSRDVGYILGVGSLDVGHGAGKVSAPGSGVDLFRRSVVNADMHG